jgi:hypothetical protein
VWGRGRSNRKVCILAAGRDAAVERGGAEDRHGRDVLDKNEMMCGA